MQTGLHVPVAERDTESGLDAWAFASSLLDGISQSKPRCAKALRFVGCGCLRWRGLAVHVRGTFFGLMFGLRQDSRMEETAAILGPAFAAWSGSILRPNAMDLMVFWRRCCRCQVEPGVKGSQL